jgi:hypothetical protein
LVEIGVDVFAGLGDGGRLAAFLDDMHFPGEVFLFFPFNRLK